MSKKVTINGQEYQVPSDVPVTVGSPYTTTTHTIQGKIVPNTTTTHTMSNQAGTFSSGSWTLGPNTSGIINNTFGPYDPEQQAEQLKQLLKSGDLSTEDLEFLLKDIKYKNKLKAIYGVVNVNVPSSYSGLSEDLISRVMADYEIEKLIEE